MKNLIVFSGAGISAESGIKTFRDHGGLWEDFNIEDVATPEAFEKNPKLVLDFYNMRRRKLDSVGPNEAHKAVADLQKDYYVHVVTQNIDNLHERAGSERVLHLHGEISKARSVANNNHVIDIGTQDINLGDLADDGHQLRPHIVWFGEDVPMMDIAMRTMAKAEILIVVGTSLNVYPAAGLVNYVPSGCERYLIDPSDDALQFSDYFNVIKAKAGEALPKLAEELRVSARN